MPGFFRKLSGIYSKAIVIKCIISGTNKLNLVLSCCFIFCYVLLLYYTLFYSIMFVYVYTHKYAHIHTALCAV